MSEVKVISRTQRIVVNPSTKSVSVINAGPQGPAGKSIAIQGTVANIAGLPSTLDFTDIGKGWITVDSGHLHVWTATGFIDVGSVLGPTGPQGIQGLSGNIGPTGPIGNTGPMGPSTADDVSFTSKYPTVVNHGATAGTARGGTAPIFWIGSVDPTNATNDDELFRTDTVILYKRVAGAWVVVSGSIYVGASAPPSPLDGKLWWDTDEVAAAQTLDPATLALDSAFTSKFSRTVNHGATAGTARGGTAPIFWIGSVDPTNATNNDAWYRTDTTALYVRVVGAWFEVGASRYMSSTRVGGQWTRVAVQPISTSGYTQVLLDTELEDTDGFLTPLSAIATIPAGKDGIYVVTALVQYTIAALGINGLRLTTSAATGPPVAALRTYEFPGSTLAGFQQGQLAGVPLFAGQTVKLETIHNAGSNQNITGYLSLHRIAL